MPITINVDNVTNITVKSYFETKSINIRIFSLNILRDGKLCAWATMLQFAE